MEMRQDQAARAATVAVWTPPGRGAVASIRVVGDLAAIGQRGQELFRAASGRVLNDLPVGRVCFGQWGRETSEDVVVCRDGEDSLEVHCHGGSAAVQRILADLQQTGCEIVDWSTQWSAAASLLDREHAEALSRATTTRTAAWIVGQAGRMSRTVDSLRALIAA